MNYLHPLGAEPAMWFIREVLGLTMKQIEKLKISAYRQRQLMAGDHTTIGERGILAGVIRRRLDDVGERHGDLATTPQPKMSPAFERYKRAAYAVGAEILRELDARDYPSSTSAGPKHERCARWLRAILPAPGDGIVERAQARGFSRTTLYRAARSLEVRTGREWTRTS